MSREDDDGKELVSKRSAAPRPASAPAVVPMAAPCDESECAVPAILPAGSGVAPDLMSYVFEGVPVVRRNCCGQQQQPKVPPTCDLCHGGSSEPGDLFRPCHCQNGERYFHRTCFRSWRTGWVTPQNYFSCPDCGTNYNIERVKASGRIESASKSRIAQHFRRRMIAFYATVVLSLALTVAAIAGLAYLCDAEDKNVPVAVKYALTGVFSGLPPSNATSVWREQFKQPDVPVWPYYTLLGAFCASVFVLIAFACMGCTFNENERQRRSCASQCGCDGDGPQYWVCCDGTCRIDVCYCPSGNDPCCCCCDGSHPHGAAHCCAHGNCDSGGSKDCGELVLALVVIIVVAILLSALVTLIAFAANKIGLFHDRMTDMMECQASELESETIVLGIDESLRPTDSV